VADGFEVGFSVGDVWLNDLQHFLGCFCQSNKNTIVDLQQSEELQDFSWFRSNFIDTAMLAYYPVELIIPLDTNDEYEFRLGGDIEIALLLGKTVQTDSLTLSITIFLDILLGSFENNLTFRLVSL